MEGKRARIVPCTCNPARAVIAVIDRTGQRTLAGAIVGVAPRHICRSDNRRIQTVCGRQVGCGDVLHFGLSNGGQRHRAVAAVVDTVYLHFIFGFVFQSKNGRRGLILAFEHGKGGAAVLLAVLHLAVLGILARLPAYGQQAIPCRYGHAVRLIGHTVGLWGSAHNIRLAALPDLTARTRYRCNGKVIGLEVFQSGNRVLGAVGLDGVGHLVRAGAIVNLIAGNILEFVPSQADFLGTRLCLYVLDLYILCNRIFRYNVLYKFNLLNDHRLIVLDFDFNGHFLDRYALAKRDGHDLAAIVTGLHGQYAVGHIVAKGLLELLAVGSLYDDDALFDRVCGRADNLYLLHLDRLVGLCSRCQRNGQFHLGRAILGCKCDRAAIVREQRRNLTSLHVHCARLRNRVGNRVGVHNLGRNQAGAANLRITRRACRHGHGCQVGNIHLTVAV